MNERTKYRRAFTAIVTTTLLIVGPALASAHTVPLAEGTPVYAEMDRVTSRKRDVATGDVLTARVASDVFVEGELVIAEGAELLVRVRHARKAKFLGRKGRLELEALSVKAVDGTEVPLQGLYVRKGKGRKVVTGTLAVVVAWPFAFLRGKNARVPEGTVFAATVGDRAWVELDHPGE